MAPPSFVELGKLCRDLLTKGYLDGYWRIDCRTMTSPGIHFSTSAQATADNNILGFIESKFRVPDTNVFLTGRWHTDNLLFGEVALIDQFTEGLKLALQGRYNMSSESETNSALFLLGYGQPAYKIDLDTTVQSNPVVNFSAVLGYEGLLGGYRGVFDTSNNEFKKHDFALGYVGPDYVAHLGINDGMKAYYGSVFWRANSAADIGVEGHYSEGDNAVQKVTVGTRYRIDEDTIVRAKIDNEANLGLGFQRRLREGVTAYISCLLVCKDIQSGEHKAGVGLEVEI